MKINSVSAGVSVVVFAVLFSLAFGNFGQGRTTAAAGSAPVTIVNTPVPITGTVTLVPSQPFAVSGGGVTQDTLFAADKFVVPAGKRLIVEMVAISARVPAGDLASCGVTAQPATAGGDPTSYRFVTTLQGPIDGSTSASFVSNPPVRLYLGPGDELTWFCFRSNGSGFITFAWSISGYLVDV
jgi:hypothetical protein